MAIKIENNTLIFESVIYEDEVNTMRDFFQEKAPENVVNRQKQIKSDLLEKSEKIQQLITTLTEMGGASK